MAGFDTYLDFARALVLVSGALYFLTMALSVAAQLLSDRRLVVAARRGIVLGSLCTVGAAAGLVVAFVRGEYHLNFVFNYSERGLGLGYKLAGLWAGLDGSLLFWSALLGVVTSIVAIQYRREDDHPVGRRLEPNVYLVFAAVQLFFTAILAFVANPFWELRRVMGDERFFTQFPNGLIPDGAGLNPLLQNYWMQIHPPCLYLGWVTYTVPFAFGIAALISGEQGKYWVRKVRRWTLIGWLFNGVGVVLGGLWAYEVLGWGGVWAWDPVENASFLPWLSATAFMHSIIVQERRGMLRNWNAFLVCLTYFLSIFGTYLTRSGIVSSVHAFASGSVGNWFFGLLMTVMVVSLVLLAYRWSKLRSDHQIESLLSREAIFVLNNLVLLAITFATMYLTLYPKMSNDWFGEPFTVSVPVYNRVVMPAFVALLLLTAIGPQLGWIRTSPKHLFRHVIVPALVSVPVAFGMVGFVSAIRGDEAGPVPLSEQFYPAGLVYFASAFIITSLGYEILRTARSRAQRRREPLPLAVTVLMVKNNRRYGGYIVHAGLALVATSLVSFGIFKEERRALLSVGETTAFSGYEVTLRDVLQDRQGVDERHGSYVYDRYRLDLEVKRDGVPLGNLYPEKRVFPVRLPTRMAPQTSTEVEIVRGPLEDFYVYYETNEAQNQFKLTFFRNPLFWVLWCGLLVMVAGALWALLPMGGKRVGLSD
ncbi:MAG: heme lyase CcmF/NrfE family subunit [Planctomycetota bacterium]